MGAYDRSLEARQLNDMGQRIRRVEEKKPSFASKVLYYAAIAILLVIIAGLIKVGSQEVQEEDMVTQVIVSANAESEIAGDPAIARDPATAADLAKSQSSEVIVPAETITAGVADYF